MDCELVQYYNEVDVWCKNEEWPPVIEIDARILRPYFPFKFIDLAKYLPDGIWLHRKYDNMYNNGIISVGDNFNYFISNKLYPFDDPSKVLKENEDESTISEELEARQEFLKNTQGIKKKSTKIVTMPLVAASSKKILQLKSEGADAAALRNSMKKNAAAKNKKAGPASAKSASSAEKTPATGNEEKK